MENEEYPKKRDIIRHWKTWLEERGFGLNKPTCWACDWHFNGRYDKKSANWDIIYRAWDKAPLQRCHIIPKSLKGSNTDPGNFFLMCKKCYDEAPNTIYKEIFMKWVNQQFYMDRRGEEISKQLKIFEMSESDKEIIKRVIKSSHFSNWYQNKTGLHWNQRGYGAELTPATYVGVL